MEEEEKKETTKKRRMGRPNLYKERILPNLDKIKDMIQEGMTETDIARHFGITHQTFSEYKKLYPDFRDTIESFHFRNIEKVKNALLKRALGFEYEETKTYIKVDSKGNENRYTEKTKKYYPPDATALAMYLRNYDKSWRDKDNFEYEFKKMELELKQRLAELKDW